MQHIRACPSRAAVQHTRSVAAVAPCRPTLRGRRTLTTVAFKTERGTQLLKAAKLYVDAWRPEVGGGMVEDAPERLAGLLKEVVAPEGVTYIADGVVHTQDRHKTADRLAQHIRDRYSAYKHVVHLPFAYAVDEEHAQVFVGVRFIMQNIGAVAGFELPTGKASAGVLLERLGFDKDGKIATSLVCRQLTAEEAATMTVNPSEIEVPPIVDEAHLFAPEETLGQKDIDAMSTNLKAWVHSWATGADLSKLDQYVDDNVCQLSGYGLTRSGIPFVGRDGARNAIERVQSQLVNKEQTIVSHAICDDKRAGFVHWRANVQSRDTSKGQPAAVEGLDYLRFNDDNQVNFIYSFTMRPYSNLRTDAPRKNVD